MQDESRSFRWLSEILEDPDALKPPRAVVPRLVWEGHTTMLAGREKGGKSTLAGAIAGAVSSGNAFFGEETTSGKVLYIGLEESTFLIANRLVKYGADPENVGIVSRGSYGKDIVAAIKEAAEEIQPDLIIWDTLGKFADILFDKPIEPGNSAEWTRVLGIIEDIARQYGATLLLHHSRKSDGKYRDSTAIGGGVDMIVEMFGERSDPRTLKGIGRFEFEDFVMTFDGHNYTIARTEDNLKEDVLAFIKKTPKCSVRAMIEGVEGRSKAVMNAKQALIEEGLIVNVGTAAKHAYMVMA